MRDDEESPPMTHPLRPMLGSLLLALATSSSACRTASRANDSDERQAKTTVSVDNREFADMSVYVLRSGQRFRLGIASGHSTTLLRIPDYLVEAGNELQFLCDPIGAAREEVSDRMTVFPGDELVLTIYMGTCAQSRQGSARQQLVHS
jgi:hypothetical protein